MRKKDNKKQELYNAYSKKRLKHHIRQKLTTTMIAALDKFETAFGYLWGGEIVINDDGEEEFVLKPDSDLTDDEKINREIWNVIRTEILDKGHDQRRYLEDELTRYTVTWNKWQTEFRVRED
jgi:hypothetical protein